MYRPTALYSVSPNTNLDGKGATLLKTGFVQRIEMEETSQKEGFCVKMLP